MTRQLRIAALLAALATPALALKGAERVTSVEGITEYKLPNGLRVLLFPDPTKQTVTVNITYLVGSRHEAYGETGMAHLLEHLVFKGTPKHPDIPQELTSHGARPNGTTSFDRTNYFETFQSTDENLRWALDLEADRMVNSFIAKKDLESEMTVVRNEFERGENEPQRVLLQRVLSTAFLWHNYGKSTIGARSDIENVPIDRLQAFYRRYYQPDNAVLTVAGKIDEEKALAMIVAAFGPIPRPERKLIPTYTAEPTQDGERAVTLRRVGDVQLLLSAWHAPSGLHADAAALDVLSFVLANEPAGRLHKALVETKKASSVFGRFWPLTEPGVFMLGAELRREMSLDEARKILSQTVEGLAKQPVAGEEVERARTRGLKNYALALNHSDRVGLALSEHIAKGDWRLFFLQRDRLRKLTPADVQRAALAYLKPSNRTEGVFIPEAKADRSEIPASPDAARLLAGYKGDAALAAGEAFDPSTANIESRVRRSRLDGGLQVALLSKKTRGGTVVAALHLRYGDEKSLHGKSAAADMAADMLLRGSESKTRQQIQDELDKLKARLSIGGGDGVLSARIETVRASLPATLRLMAEVLQKPSWPADQFEELRQQNLAGIEERRNDPGSLASTAFGRHQQPFPKGDPRYVATPDELVEEYKAVRLDDAKGVQAMVGASHGELSVVGDFDAGEIGALAAELLGGWKTPAPYQRIPYPFHVVPAMQKRIEAPDKANAVLVAGLNLKLRDDHADYPALTLGNYMLGGGFLNSRLATRIRRKDGLSYGVGSRLNARPLDESGAFQASAIFAPQNSARLEKAFREELERALKDGFGETEIREAKAGWLQSRQVARAQDAGLAGTLAGHMFVGRTLAWDGELEKKVAALTAEQIAEAMRRHIDPARITIVQAGDFAKAAAAVAVPAN